MQAAHPSSGASAHPISAPLSLDHLPPLVLRPATLIASGRARLPTPQNLSELL